MVKKRSIFLMIIMSFMFIGCTTSDSTNDSADNNFTILEGTVPGTLIEVFCIDGSYYKTNSTQDGTDKHPFSIQIPKNLNCHLVMSTNEDNISKKVINPISIIDTIQAKGSLFHGVSDKVDLGHVALALDRTQIVDSTNDGVVDTPIEAKVRSGTLKVVEINNDPLDRDKDGIINIYEDDDNDSKYNKIDDDDDGDGIKDDEDDDYKNDADHDGIKDDEDDDDDNDGIKDDDDDDDHDSKKDDDDDDDDDD